MKFQLFANSLSLETSENKTVDGNSIVGNVNSNDGQLKLDRSNGNANPNDGVGLVARQYAYWTLLRQPPSMRPISLTLGLQLVQSRFVRQLLSQQDAQLELNNLCLS